MKMSRLFLPALGSMLVAGVASAGGGKRTDATANVALDGTVVRNARAVEVHVGANAQAMADRSGMAVRRTGGSVTGEVRFRVGVVAGGLIWQRLSDALNGKVVRPIAVSVVTAAGGYLLNDAALTEVAFPALDAGDDAPLAVSVALAASDVKGGAGTVANPSGADRAREPLRSGFRLSLDHLDTTRVSRIDAFTLKLSAQQGADKTGRVRQVAGQVTLPALSVYLDASAPGLAGWRAWIDDLAAGKASSRSGRLELIASGAKEAAFDLQLHDVAITAIHDVVEGERRRLKVDLVIGRASLGAGAPPPAR